MTISSDAKMLADLQAAFVRGRKMAFVFFWGHTPKSSEPGPWCLSQWWPAPFTIGGASYPTAEHFMMAEKARLFGDDEALQRILAADSPRQAKAYGRAVRGFVEATWVEYRFEIVKSASIAKFSQHDDLHSYLLGTKNRILAEASPRDSVWGIGLSANDAAAENPLRWKGLNLLGFALMQTRAELRGEHHH